MEDLEKKRIYGLVQLSLKTLETNKFQVTSFSPYYAVDGTSGIRFTAKTNSHELPFFVGFSTDKKYEDKLLFGILKSESNEKIEKLNLDEDINGNKIQEKISINEKFLSLDESEQKSKISKWLNEQIRTIFALYTMWNGRPKAESTEQSPIKRKNVLSVICLLFGSLGIHRFMLRQWGIGILQLFTLGGFFIWWIIDTVRLFTGNFPDSDGILFKDKIEEYKKVHPKNDDDIEQYEDINAEKWFKIVELPWLITALGVIPGCFVPFVDEANEILMMVLVAISSIIFMVGLILIFATLGKKKKIRLANNIPITKNPYTWFLSKIGKAVCGTTILVVGFGIFIMIAFITTASSSGGARINNDSSTNRSASGRRSEDELSEKKSSGGTRSENESSKNKSSTGTRTENVFSTNRSSTKPMYWWACSYCRTKVQKVKFSSPANVSGSCPYSLEITKFHLWKNYGEVGTETWQCGKCNLTLELKSSPPNSSRSCGGTGSHSWHKL